MAKPTLTQAAFLAALSTFACSRSAERMSAEPAAAAPPAMPTTAAPKAESAPSPQPTGGQAAAAPNASASAPAPTLANKQAVGSGTELKQGKGVKPRSSADPQGGQMTCSANGCSPDMKKNTQ